MIITTCYLYDQKIDLKLRTTPDNIHWKYEMYNHRIQVYKDIDNPIHISVRNDNQKKLSIGGYDIVFSIIDNVNNTGILLSKSATIIDATAGIAEVVINCADLLDIDPQLINYSIKVIDADSTRVGFIDGAYGVVGQLEILGGVYPTLVDSKELNSFAKSSITDSSPIPQMPLMEKYSLGDLGAASSLAQLRARCVTANKEAFTPPDRITSSFTPPDENDYIIKLQWLIDTGSTNGWSGMSFFAGNDVDDGLRIAAIASDKYGTLGATIGQMAQTEYQPAAIVKTTTFTWPTDIRYVIIETYFIEIAGGEKASFSFSYMPTGGLATPVKFINAANDGVDIVEQAIKQQIYKFTSFSLNSNPKLNQNTALHTAAFYVDNYTGEIEIQATLSDNINPPDVDFFSVKTIDVVDANGIIYTNWNGVHDQVRFVHMPSAGLLNKILYRP